MDTQERILCRLCFKICHSFEAFEGELKGILYMVLKKIDLTIIQKPMICTRCTAKLIKFSQFKKTCLYARDYILPFSNRKDDDLKLNLKEVYLSMRENDISLSEAQDICGFCMSPVKSSSALSFDVEGGDIMLHNMKEQCLPELDFSIIKKPVICAPCHATLESCFCFVTNCLIVEKKIKKYRESQDINGKGQIEPRGLLEFITKDVIKEVEKENADDEEIGNEGDMIKVEQIIFDVNKIVKQDLDIKNESCMEIDDHCGGDIKIEETFSGEIELKVENIDVVDQLNEEINIKAEESNFNRFEDDVVFPQLEVTTRLHRKQKNLMSDLGRDLSKPCIQQKSTDENVPTITTYKCDFCQYQTRYKYSLKRHTLSHSNLSELTLYKCNFCLFQTEHKDYLKTHLRIHNDPAEVKMYKCSLCSFQTKFMRSLKRHMLKHKDPSEITMYKCSLCSFQTKLKMRLKPHMLQHKDPSEVTMYECSVCSFQTKLKSNLKQHNMRQHKDPSEVTMYKCSLCSYQTKVKSSLKRHMLKHKDLSEVTMYKCDSCVYQTKYKGHLKEHLLKHKDPSEVTMYKCDTCLYQTIRKRDLKMHLLTHKSSLEVAMYKCSLCSFQTKLKMRHKPHILKHKDPLEVAMHRCSLCSFQTKLKSSLKRHMLKHKDISEVTIYKCDSCLYQTKYKGHLKEHLLKHKDPSQVTMYKCSLCLFQTKLKSSLKRHILTHKDLSEVTMYKCDSCLDQKKHKNVC